MFIGPFKSSERAAHAVHQPPELVIQHDRESAARRQGNYSISRRKLAKEWGSSFT